MQDLLDYWSSGNPPLHRIAAAYFGIEEQGEEQEHRVMSKEELEAFIRQAQG